MYNKYSLGYFEAGMTAPDVNFTSDSLCVLLSDWECSSISTSLLFNHALSAGRWNGCSTIIRPDRLTSIPLRFFDAPERPPVGLVRKIEFVYLPDRDECVDYAARVYDCVGVPASLVVDSLERYSESRLVGYASLFALLHDLGSWIGEKRKMDDSGRELAPVVCSVAVDRSQHETMIDLIERYTKCIWILRADEERGTFLLYRLGGKDRVKMKIENADRIVPCQ
jgi:hypothetical protein